MARRRSKTTITACDSSRRQGGMGGRCTHLGVRSAEVSWQYSHRHRTGLTVIREDNIDLNVAGHNVFSGDQ
jgi:hypothetical protein